ncbi:MAG: hypothetical protein HC869_00745 [Rhodospirillales bacterium]|nr:hypothetical protein [Rhodospirillales bacterium]
MAGGSGIDYDVVTDDVLHEEGASLLSPYRCIVTGTHPEYHSVQMLDGIDAWLGTGGRLVYLGGNGFYWRAATHDAHPGVIEVRRGEAGTRCFEMPAGERHNQFDGEFGGLWRSNGRPPQSLVGVGFVAEGFDSCHWYERTDASFDPRAAFIFEGTNKEDRIGDFGVLGGAAGLELDAADPTLGTPAHALVLARSAGYSNVYLVTVEEMMSTHPSVDGSTTRWFERSWCFLKRHPGEPCFRPAPLHGLRRSLISGTATTSRGSPAMSFVDSLIRRRSLDRTSKRLSSG